MNVGSIPTPLCSSAIYDFGLGWPVTPHIGVGLGGARVNGNVDGPNVGFHSRTSDVVFVYPAIAGARYMLTPAIALDLDYRYRGSTEQSFTTREFTVTRVVTFPSRKYSGSGNTNNIVASVTYLFLPPPPPLPSPAAPPPPAANLLVSSSSFDWRPGHGHAGGYAGWSSRRRWRIGQAAPRCRVPVTRYTDRSGSPASDRSYLKGVPRRWPRR